MFQLIPPNELSAKEVKTADAARREFGVDMVLTIGLQRSGDKMRITCSLIDPRNYINRSMHARSQVTRPTCSHWKIPPSLKFSACCPGMPSYSCR